MIIKEEEIDYDTFRLLLNEQHFGVNKIEGVTKRTLNHWRKIGHLEDHREHIISGKPNFFSPLELVWISIISDLREMKIEHSKIKGVKSGLFALVKAENGKEYTALEYYMAQVFEFNVTLYIILSDTNELSILNDMVYIDKIKSGEIENHTAISLNKQIKDTLNEVYIIPEFSDFSDLTVEEIQVLTIIRNKTYKYINITKNNGEITRLEGVEEIKGSPRIEDLIKQRNYQNLEIKQHNGQIVCVYRKIRQKIKK